MQNSHDVIVLFSGGLDSILAAHLLMEQGLKPLCVNFTSHFFGKKDKIEHWKKVFNLEIISLDISKQFVDMLVSCPQYGIGKVINPCVDCKILQMRLAKKIMIENGAKFIASGEVLGQRPMSQRTDVLNTIQNKADVSQILLRPLSARLLPITPMEKAGIVDRERLASISGRGRDAQFELAKKFGIKEIPTPGGGCKLTEKENARRYWQILKPVWLEQQNLKNEVIFDNLTLSNYGRHLFCNEDRQDYWLCIGRNEMDNKNIERLKKEDDVIIKLNIPGPLALAKNGKNWPNKILKEAAEIVASYSHKAKPPEAVSIAQIIIDDQIHQLEVLPNRNESRWFLQSWEKTRQEIHLARKILSKNV